VQRAFQLRRASAVRVEQEVSGLIDDNYFCRSATT